MNMNKNMSKRILNVLPDLFPPELRVENAAQALSEAGYTLSILARPSQISSERWNGPIIPIDPPGRPGKMIRGLRKRLLAPLNPSWHSNLSKQWIIKAANEFKPDAIIWNDLASAHLGQEIAHNLNSNFILDFHENYPYNMWSTARDRGSNSRAYSLSAWLAYEKHLTQQANLILTPAEEMNERLHSMHFTENEKMLEILNSEDHLAWDAMPRHRITEMDPEKDHMLYVGSASIHRGLDLIIKAIASIKGQWPNLMFTIVGAGRSISIVNELVDKLGLNKHVQLLGKRPFSEMASFIEASSFGVIPHYRYGQTDNTLPHKLFQFAAMRKPVLVSNCKSLERIANEHNLGLIFKSGNIEDAATQLLKFKSSNLRLNLGENGRKAIEGPLNLRVQQSKLVEAINGLLS
jgi:glycosyltransferase involved in cell wall biosynthesis